MVIVSQRTDKIQFGSNLFFYKLCSAKGTHRRCTRIKKKKGIPKAGERTWWIEGNKVTDGPK